ncbi:hypothetical protein [Agromyces sp. M3QZ16-3]|uniref:hypothetical protein n=1 Tax=Agromyces sp. M3QZ16-3 TaxID=3447585 RepID=UPI003F68FF11
MDPALVWGIVGGVAAVLALIGAAYTAVSFYRQFPRRRLEYIVWQRPLVASGHRVDDLVVTVQGMVVDDPHLVRVLFYSNSRADIPSTAFDAGKPIVIRVEPGGAILTNSETGTGSIAIEGGSDEGLDLAEFRIQPALIRKRSTGSIAFVASGSPRVRVDSPLIDIDVRDMSSLGDENNRRLAPRVVRARFLATAFVAPVIVGAVLLILSRFLVPL